VLKSISQWLNQAAKIALTALVVWGLSAFSYSSPVAASSKAATPEALELAINESAQEFVDSVLDDYGDILESTFDTAYDPLKSAVKSVAKQLSKATKTAGKGVEGTAAPAIMIPQETFQAAVDSFAALQETTAGFQSQLESSPEVIQGLIEEQIGAKMAVLEQAIADVAATVDLIAEDVSSLDAADPTTTAAFQEHSMALTQSIQAVDLAIDGFDS